MNIAIIAETAPAKTLIPILERLDEDIHITALTHSEGAEELLSIYADEVIPIGKGRRNTDKKRSNAIIASLVMKDTLKTYHTLKKRNIDLVITCGNAGDVRKGLLAAKKLDIPSIHIEQDIYNPIETIAYANIITVPDQKAQKKLKKMYKITNTINIRGYPQAAYVSEVELIPKDEIYDYYQSDDFYVAVLGGDIRSSEVPLLVKSLEKLAKPVYIVPYRFSTDFVTKYVTCDNIHVIDGYVDLISLMNASSGVIYAAGMGITIEVGVLEVPAVKIKGFHLEHQSNELAQILGIEISSIDELPFAVARMQPPHGKLMIRKGIKASWRIVELIRDMKMFDQNKGGYTSLKNIWEQRKKYR